MLGLVVVPAAYTLVDDVEEWVLGRWRRKRATVDASISSDPV
ncbi:hypothetical protein [Pseudoxanthomonas suwonensis]|nr:hypothetical protein [Pseudoxanthomonas suwonensis]